MSPSSRRALTVLALALASATALAADTLVYRNGQRVQGRLIAVRDGTIEFETSGRRSRTLRVDQDEVRQIEFDDDGDEGGGFGGGGIGGGGRPGTREREVQVTANQQWTDTGIDVRPGQTVTFRADGEIRWGPSRRDGPEGEDNSPRNPGRPMPSRPAAALIGRTGEDVFFIGNDSGGIRLRGGGRLYLGINDDFLQDNSGYFRVTVYY